LANPVHSGLTSGDASKVLTDLIVVTIPAVLLYFVGWVYLYFYLGAFGIGVSELDLDIQTIFLYFLPPIRLLAKFIWDGFLANLYLAGGLLVLIAIAAVLFKQCAPGHFQSLGQRLSTSFNNLRELFASLQTASVIVQCLLVFVLLVSLAIIAVPVIRSTAGYAADRQWVTRGTMIAAMIKKADEMQSSSWFDNYKACSERRALNLIFADKETYFMLCIDKYDASFGVVYEVRRDAGLASVRPVTRKR
jgi:hypothetical protein